MNVTLAEAVAFLEGKVHDPGVGLPDEIFYFISRMTPLVNVDLLVKNEHGHTLLAWRDDPFCGSGWHIPGGIVRMKETMATRLQKVSLGELGVLVEFDPNPVAMHELIHQERQTRSHFISFLFNCRLPGDFVPVNEQVAPGEAGFVAWHASCPDNMITYHDFYKKYI